MSFDFSKNEKVKVVSAQKVAEMFINDEEYTTQSLMTRTIVNGKEVIRGVFQSTKKYVRQLSGAEREGEDLVEGEKSYFYTNNQIQQDDCKSISRNLFGENTHSHKISSHFSFRYVIFLAAIAIILFVIMDLFKYKDIVKSENSIELNECIREYEANECEKLTIEDGPLLNDFCKKKQKCIEYYNQVFHFKILSRYLGDVISGVFSTDINMAKLGTTCLILIVTSFIFRILK